MFGGTATTKSGLVSMDGSNQISNVVRYETPTWQGLTLGGMWAPGGVAGDNSASSKYAATAVYKGIDHLTLVAGQIWLNDSTGVTTGRTRVLGGNYKFLDDKAVLAAGYITLENPSKNGQANSEFTLKDITAKYYITPKFDISGGWYKLDDEVNSANSARQLSLVGNYNIVKNVDIYAGWAQMKNQGGLGLAPLAQGAMSYNSLSSSYSGSVVSQPGQTHDAVMVGMQIRF
jgi:predicted porin